MPDGDTKAVPTFTREAIPWRFVIPALMIGLPIGLIAGLLIGVSVSPKESTDVPKEAETLVQASPERWYVWSGNAPASGNPFGSESECESYRRDQLNRMREEAARAVNEIGAMSINQIRALGYDPRERIVEQVREAEKAYCRRASM